MNKEPPFDARSVANLMLAKAESRGLGLTNLALQKLLYFAHGQYLISTGTPLVTGYFEAWRLGPVHPHVYEAFREFNGRPITKRAVGIDYAARREVALPMPTEPRAIEIVERVVMLMGHVPATRLVEISHAPRGPWGEVVKQADVANKAGTKSTLGLRISDKITVERFRFLLVPIRTDSPGGDSFEDTPLA